MIKDMVFKLKDFTLACANGVLSAPIALKQKLVDAKNDVFEVRSKLKNMRQSNFDLGIYHLEKGNFKDAIFRFKLIDRFLDKDNPKVIYQLGIAYFMNGDYVKSKAVLEKAVQEDEIKLLRFLNNIDSVTEVSKEICKLHRDLNSSNYYQPEEKAQELVKELIDVAEKLPKNYKILEIGCGAGVLGNQIRLRMQESFTLTGVEPSEKISALQNKYFGDEEIYDEVINNSQDDYLKTSRQKFDVVFSMHGLPAKENLQDFFAQVEAKIKKNGYFAIMIATNTINVFDKKNLSFIYNHGQVANLLTENNFNIFLKREINLEKNKNYSIFICTK